jgi:hypothetical protein
MWYFATAWRDRPVSLQSIVIGEFVPNPHIWGARDTVNLQAVASAILEGVAGSTMWGNLESPPRELTGGKAARYSFSGLIRAAVLHLRLTSALFVSWKVMSQISLPFLSVFRVAWNHPP